MRLHAMSRLLLVLLVAGAAVSPLRAVSCPNDKSVTDCWTDSFDKVNRAAVVGRTETETQEALAAEPTGVDTGGANLASNTKSFLPLLAASGLLGNSSKANQDGTYVLDLNFLIPGLAKEKNAQLQAVVNSQPKVSGGVSDRLPEATRADTVKKLEGTLGDLDDYTLSFTYNWVDRHHGRGYAQYADRFTALANALWGHFNPLASLAEFGKKQELKFRGSNVDYFNDTFEQIATKTSPDRAASLKAETEAEIDRQIQALTVERKAFADYGLLRFADLLDNQPQLYISAMKHHRTPLVGSDETSVKVTYGWGVANLNAALTGACDTDLGMPGECLERYRTFVEKNQAALADGTKFAFSGEYMSLAKDVVNLPAQGITGLTIPSAKKLIVSAGYTKMFNAGQGGPIRMDFVAKYENVSDDPSRRDRGVATLTITRQFGNLTIPFGLVYANHGEFLGQVDKQLSAHLGLKFSLFGN